MGEVIFYDSCGDYAEQGASALVVLQGRYDSYTTSNFAIATGRRGGSAYRVRHARTAVKQFETPVFTLGIGIAYIHPSLSYTEQVIRISGPGVNIGIQRNTHAKLQISINSVIVGQTERVFSVDNWNYVKVIFHSHPVDGFVDVLDGGKFSVLKFEGDTGTEGFNRVSLGCMATQNEWSLFDDLYVEKLYSPGDYGTLGNIYVGADTPDTTVQAQGTPSDPESDNHEMVNEYGEGAPDDDETYVTLEQGQKDRYGFAPLPTNGKIHAIQLTTRYRSQDGGLPQVKASIESDGQEVSNIDTPDANQEYRYKNTVIANTDPATNEPWTKEGADSMSAGIEVLDD